MTDEIKKNVSNGQIIILNVKTLVCDQQLKNNIDSLENNLSNY